MVVLGKNIERSIKKIIMGKSRWQIADRPGTLTCMISNNYSKFLWQEGSGNTAFSANHIANT
jgi:hypothetical protein